MTAAEPDDVAARSVPDGRRERNKAEKRRRIVAAGRFLFRSQGFEATTTAAIAAHAGVGAGTFYLYVRSKEDLLVAVFEEDVSRAWADAFALGRPVPLVGGAGDVGVPPRRRVPRGGPGAGPGLLQGADVRVAAGAGRSHPVHGHGLRTARGARGAGAGAGRARRQGAEPEPGPPPVHDLVPRHAEPPLGRADPRAGRASVPVGAAAHALGPGARRGPLADRRRAGGAGRHPDRNRCGLRHPYGAQTRSNFGEVGRSRRVA